MKTVKEILKLIKKFPVKKAERVETTTQEKWTTKLGGPLGDGDYYPSHEKIMRNNPAV